MQFLLDFFLQLRNKMNPTLCSEFDLNTGVKLARQDNIVGIIDESTGKPPLIQLEGSCFVNSEFGVKKENRKFTVLAVVPDDEKNLEVLETALKERVCASFGKTPGMMYGLLIPGKPKGNASYENWPAGMRYTAYARNCVVKNTADLNQKMTVNDLAGQKLNRVIFDVPSAIYNEDNDSIAFVKRLRYAEIHVESIVPI